MSSTFTGRTRRQFLNGLFGLGTVAVALANLPLGTDAARRGYSGPDVTSGGLVVAVLEGFEPGTIQYDMFRSRLGAGPYLTVVNRTDRTLEIEVVMQDGSSSQHALAPNDSLLMRVGSPGIVRLRAWLIGTGPGEFIELDFRA